ncbi:MAG: hypothetical protein KF773_30500 [Deltaproteobacteria bacterium]|nr:hypothetical protein [Deltaproteobacteria bacterium]MCW5805684.1 hypothetical protein [Deltaproteobacteria bacterium]
MLSVALVLGVAGTSFADSTAAKRPAAASIDDLSLIPVDSELVGGLDWAQLQTSPLWQKHVEPLMRNAMAGLPSDFVTSCGDPAKMMSRLSFGLKGLQGGSPEGVVVMYGVSKPTMTKCMEKGKSTPDAKLTRDGDYFLVSGGGNNAAFTFLDNTTLLGVIGPQGTKAGVKAVAAGGSALKKSPTFLELYGKTRTSDTLWVLVNGNSKLFDGAGAGLGMKPKAIFGSLNVGKSLTLDARIRVESSSQASSASSLLQSQAGQLSMFVDKLDIGADGPDVTISAALSEAKIKMLLGLLGKSRAP